VIMERVALFPPEVDAELIALAQQGDPRAVAIKKLIEEMVTIRQEMESNKDSVESLIPSYFSSSSLEHAIRDRIYYRMATRRVFVSLGASGQRGFPTPEGPSEQERQKIPQELQGPVESVHRPESSPEKSSTYEDHPYQTIQLVCASIFLLCASAIPAWLTLGIQFISPLVAFLGMIGAVTVYAMSWAAGRGLKSEMTTERQ